MDLSTPLRDVLRTTGNHLRELEDMGLHTVGELLLYLPRGHEDLSRIETIARSPIGEKVTLRGTVSRIQLVRTRQGKRLVKALFSDAEGDMAEVVWFNQPHVKRMLQDGDEVVLTGKLQEEGMKLKLLSPQFELAGVRPLIHSGRLVPVYPQHDIISTKWLREKMVLVRDVMLSLPETLPGDILAEEGLLSRAQAIEALHFPEKAEDVERALKRMAFEEMYLIQLNALRERREWQKFKQERLKVPMNVELMKDFFQSLKFIPTGSQKIAIYEILRDMEKDTPMSRLLEGDVGSGKTLVATAVMANVLARGGQCALMVPTEVLARQHVDTVGRTLIRLHAFLFKGKEAGRPQIRQPVVALLTGSLPAEESSRIRRAVADGRVDIVIGTHALIQDAVEFRDLRLVIVDEQHRFGVEQRERLQLKGNPHFLAMTATPIPRTLALTAYGQHDLSVLVEKPGNRKRIHTKVVSPHDRKTVDLFIDSQIAEGRQAFVICPLIEESGNEDLLEVKNVERESEQLRERFPNRKIASLHGRMAPKEKEAIMSAFKNKKFHILVSTSVIEVGIDVPNATIIVVEGAERFGLAQLHQFRGRVGRSDLSSHCFLFTTNPEQARSPRLKAMEEHESGFVLAEIDLKLRGPGELFGKRQSGFALSLFQQYLQPEFIVRARRAAEKTLGEMPFKESSFAARL